MSRLIKKEDIVSVANRFTFTDEVQRKQYMDFLEYCIDNAPTAFNLDKVVRELEEAKKNICGSYNYKTPLLENPSHKIAFNNGVEKAIEIIKEEVQHD